MNFLIREANVQDGASIAELVRNSLGSACDGQVVSKNLEARDRFTYVAEYSGNVIGFIDAELYSPVYYFDKHMNITGLAVDKNFRRGGLQGN